MKRERWVFLGVALMCGTMLMACGESQAGNSIDGVPQGQADMPQPYLDAQPGPGGPTGIVQEVLTAGRYTYARVTTTDTEIWTAAPGAGAEVGDTIYLAGADNMGAWASESIDKTWDEIFFLPGYQLASATDGQFSGVILETMNAAGYTYVQVEVSEELAWLAPPDSEEPHVWLAGPETALTVGDELSWQGGSVMREFHSSTLDRTFAEILFIGSFAGN